jgi:hypothetical protein
MVCRQVPNIFEICYRKRNVCKFLHNNPRRALDLERREAGAASSRRTRTSSSSKSGGSFGSRQRRHFDQASGKQEQRPTTAEELLGKAWETGVADNWTEHALARGLRHKGKEGEPEEDPAQALLRKACSSEGLHPKAWTPDKIARTAFLAAKGSASLKDEGGNFEKKSGSRQAVASCCFVAGSALELQADALVSSIESGGEVAGVNLMHEGTSMPVMFEDVFRKSSAPRLAGIPRNP